MRNTDAPVPAPITRATILADTNAIISDATSSGTFNVKGEIFQRPVTFSPERVVAQLQELAETNPQKAILLRAELTTRLTPIEAGNLNRMLAGDAGFFEGMTIAVNDPRDAAIGAAKGVANDGIGLVNMLAKGQALSTAEDTQQSADILRLFGNDKAAGQMESAAGVYRDIAAKGMLPTIAYKNDAQSGGANIATIVELATGVGGIAKGGAKLLAKKSDDIAEAAVRQGDEVASPLARQLDRFDTLAANAKLDMPHILDGHLNTKGKAVGFHARPDGIDPPNARMTEQVGLTNPQGVYVGRVEIAGIPKKQISTFFPDTMSAKEIEAAVRNAYADAIRNNRVDQFGRFTGDSGLNFDITGVAMNNEIPTAYPIMK